MHPLVHHIMGNPHIQTAAFRRSQLSDIVQEVFSLIGENVKIITVLVDSDHVFKHDCENIRSLFDQKQGVLDFDAGLFRLIDLQFSRCRLDTGLAKVQSHGI